MRRHTETSSGKSWSRARRSRNGTTSKAPGPSHSLATQVAGRLHSTTTAASQVTAVKSAQALTSLHSLPLLCCCLHRSSPKPATRPPTSSSAPSGRLNRLANPALEQGKTCPPDAGPAHFLECSITSSCLYAIRGYFLASSAAWFVGRGQGKGNP